MIFKDKFYLTDIQKMHHSFDVTKLNKCIAIHFVKFPFEHISINIIKPNNELYTTLTFKTYTKDYLLTNDIVDGTWVIEIVRTYQIRKRDYEIEILVCDYDELDKQKEYFNINQSKYDMNKIYSDKAKWYNGEIHCHTLFSDGRQTALELISDVKNVGLDFLAITEHNVLYPYLESDRRNGLMLVPSFELTLDDFGHYNIYGIDNNIDYSRYISENRSLSTSGMQILYDVKNNGSAISLNHPFCGDCCPASRDFMLELIDLFEIVNGANETSDAKDNLAVKALDFIWSCGYTIFAVGGSDAHNKIKNDMPGHVGNPYTRVYLDQMSIFELINAMKSGRIIVSINTDIQIKILHNEKEIFPGASNIFGDVCFDIKADKDLTWNIVTNTKITQSKHGNNIKFDLHILEKEFIRLEARDKNENIVVYVNPIYSTMPKKVAITWFDVLDRFGNNPRRF